MANCKVLSAKKPCRLDQIWRDFKRTGSRESCEQLILRYLPLVKNVALRAHTRLPSLVELDDLYQTGILGLRRALDKYDGRRANKFETFAVFHIRGAIFDDLRSSDWAPRLVRKRTQIVETAAADFESTHGVRPTDEELAAHLGLSAADFQVLKDDSTPVTVTSLSRELVGNPDGERSAIADSVADARERPPLDDAARRDLKEFITRGLERKERLILTLYYYEDMTMREVGETLGISESRVSQLHDSIMKRLKARLGRHEAEFHFDHEPEPPLGRLQRRPPSCKILDLVPRKNK